MTAPEFRSRLLFVSVIVSDDQGKGHVFPYAEAVGEACRQNGWGHLALVPETVTPDRLRLGWRRVLPGAADHSRWRTLCDFRRAFRAQLVELCQRADGLVLFVDPTTVTTLAALWSVVGEFRENLRVCLMFRYDSSTTRGELPAYGWLNRAFARKLGSARVVTVTDSEPLREFLGDTFCRQMHVLPIPHTFSALAEKKPGMPIVCWWPGKPIENKGRAILQRLACTAAPHSTDFIFRGARSAAWEQVPGGPRVELLPDRLAGSDYADQMTQADVILLPYAPAVYRRRTSGIFVEAVVAGKIPVVSAGTWAASELLRHGLPELAWDDWAPETTFVRLRSLWADGDLRSRLAALRRQYAREHSISGYAAALSQLFR